MNHLSHLNKRKCLFGLYHCKFNIFGLRTAGQKNKQFEGITLGTLFI